MANKNDVKTEVKADETGDGVVFTTTERISEDAETDNSFKGKLNRLVRNKKVIISSVTSVALITAGTVFVVLRGKSDDEPAVEATTES